MSIESFGLIISIIGVIAAILEKAAPDLNNKLSIRLNLLKNKQYSEIFYFCDIFIEEFENFYFESNLKLIKFQFHLWAWIIISFIHSLVFGLFSVIIDEIIEVHYALFVGFFAGTLFFVIFISFIKNYNESNSFFEKILVSLKYRNFRLPDSTKFHPTIKLIFFSILTALKFSIWFLIMVVVVRFVIPLQPIFEFSSTVFFETDIDTYLFLSIILTLFLSIMIFLLALFSYSILYLVSNYKFFIISPIRTIGTSLVAILFFSLWKIEVIDSFISDFYTFGWIILFYGLLNVFADSFSTLETYYVLNKISHSRKANEFIVFLIIDFIASALIFFVIPLMTGNFNIFFDAIWFKGESPWLGILFWTTFSTSLSLYLYILSIIILATIYRYSRIDEKYIPFTTKPIRALTLIVIIIISIFFFIEYIISLPISILGIILIIFLYIFIRIRLFKKRNKTII